jgi:hypothetical protein
MSRIIELAQAYTEFITGDDGFVVYWPKKERWGAYTAHDLRSLADELDRRNAAWPDTEIYDSNYCGTFLILPLTQENNNGSD